MVSKRIQFHNEITSNSRLPLSREEDREAVVGEFVQCNFYIKRTANGRPYIKEFVRIKCRGAHCASAIK